MNVIGISPLDKDATVALMVDGRVTWAIAEERLSRKKMHAGFPYAALQEVLDRAGIVAADVDHVVYAFFDWEKETQLMRKNVEADFTLNRSPARAPLSELIRQAQQRATPSDLKIPGLGDPNERMHKPWLKQLCYRLASGDGWLGAWVNRRQFSDWLDRASSDHRKYHHELLQGLEQFGLADRLSRVEHHQSHVANAFYGSGFEKALVVTVDAYGSGLSGTVTLADPDGFKRIDRIETPYSLGVFYESVTSALGYSPDRHAGKIVGLAAYGDPEVLGDVLRNLLEWDGGTFRMRRSSDLYLGRRLAALFSKIDVAAAYQTVLEEVVTRHVTHHVQETGSNTVVLSGGVAANVKLNQRVHEIPGVRNVYVHPGMGDGGCSVGAAALKTMDCGIRPAKMTTCYLGQDFSEEEILAALKEAELDYERHDDVEAEIARRIANDQVVARFNGRMEYGPRALGNRSILYPAKQPEVNQWLNERLGRTEFMPFAPATLMEDRDKCYNNIDGAEFTSQFMTITFNCTTWMREHCPAAVHIDGTARPQLVSEETNPSFHRILQEYKQLTGIPSVINTSFNMHEEPIVCSPEDAIRAFQLGRLDCLAIGSFIVTSAEAKAAQSSDQSAMTT